MTNGQNSKLENNQYNGNDDNLEGRAIGDKLSRDKDLENEYLTSRAMRRANTRMEQ